MATRTMSTVAFRVLVGGAVLSGLWAVKVTHDRHQLKQVLAQLQQEHARVTQELNEAQETIHVQSEDLHVLRQDLAALQATLAEREGEVARLEQERTGLTRQLASVQQDNAALEAKLASLKELKAAIRLVKQKIRRERWEAWLARVRQQQQEDGQRLAGGNRGYVVRQGFSTLGARVSAGTRLQVRVLEPEVP
ncbi:MAG: hypothetical protein HY595_06000 [Candidatus Omnitrophica bacterium]|nr:hypothetical protein [Candidatus Omnitrophota bacterium]